MKDKNKNILEGNIPITLFKLGGPMVFGIFFILFFILVDVFFIAKLGEEALTAVSFTIPVIAFIDAMIIGFGVATTVVVSKNLGSGSEEKAKKRGVHAILITLLIVAAFCIVGQILMKPLFQMIGAPSELMPLIEGYMFFSYFGLISLVPALIGNSVMRGAGNTFIPAAAMLIAAIMNAILDPLLIFGLLGFPRLGMNGAAIATIIARCTGFIFVFYYLAYRFHVFQLASKWYRGFVESAKEILETAIPAATANIVPPMTAIVLTGLIAQFGSEAVAAYGVATRLELLFYVPFFGASAALSPFIGQNWGAKKYHRIKEAVHTITVFNLGWAVTVAAVFFFVGEVMICLFSDNPETIKDALLYFMIVPISYIGVALIQVTASYLNATGRPRSAMMIPLLQFLGLILPLAYLGGHFFGLIAIFIAICVANIVTGIGFYTVMRRSL